MAVSQLGPLPEEAVQAQGMAGGLCLGRYRSCWAHLLLWGTVLALRGQWRAT